MRRYICYVTIILIGVATLLHFSHHIYAQNNTTVNLSIHYDITGSMIFTNGVITTSGGQQYSSGGILSAQVVSSTGGTLYWTFMGSGSTLSGHTTITGNTTIIFSGQSDGTYTLGGYLQSINNGWYLLDDITVTIDRTGPSLPMIAQSSYTTTVGNTIILSWSTGSDNGVGGPIRYSYDIVGSSTGTLGTVVSIQTTSHSNPLNTTILPIGNYTISIRSYDLLGNTSILTGISLSLNPTTNISNNVNNTAGLSDNTPVLMRDICLCGDQSNSYYDRRCSTNGVSEDVYMVTYCYTGSASHLSNGISSGNIDKSIPGVDYIQTVLQTLGPKADRIQYTQYNKQEIVINQTTSGSANTHKVTGKDTDVLSYSLSRPGTGQLGKVTLLIDALKNLLPSHYVDENTEIGGYNTSVCHARTNTGSGLWGTMRSRRLWIQYCTWGGYLMIGIIIAILLKRTKLYYYNDHGHTIISINSEATQPIKKTHKKSRQKFDK